MNSDRKKTLIAIASYYVIKKRRKRLLEKERKKEENRNIGFLQTFLSLYSDFVLSYKQGNFRTVSLSNSSKFMFFT